MTLALRARAPRIATAFAASVLLLISVAGCGRQASAPEAAQNARPTADVPFPPPQAGTIAGVVAYSGPDPDVSISPTADPTCATLRKEPLTTETVVGDGEGHLGNVFVYVKSGLEPRTYPAPTTKAELDQDGCTYRPRVLGLRVGQALVIRNSDATVHNVYALPGANPQFNEGLPYSGMQFEKVFDKPQVMLQMKCNVHPWMSAWIGILDHPYFAVTAPDGRFEIRDLAPGTYRLAAWHETFGTREQTVTIAPDGRAEVSFDYGTGAAVPQTP